MKHDKVIVVDADLYSAIRALATVAAIELYRRDNLTGLSRYLVSFIEQTGWQFETKQQRIIDRMLYELEKQMELMNERASQQGTNSWYGEPEKRYRDSANILFKAYARTAIVGDTPMTFYEIDRGGEVIVSTPDFPSFENIMKAVAPLTAWWNHE